MLIREVINQFRHFAEDMTGYTPDDTTYSDYAIYHQLLLARANSIKQLKKGFSETMYQALDCIELELIESNQCEIALPSGCKVLRSKCDLPEILMLKGVTTLLGDQIDLLRWDRVEGKLNSTIPKIRNGRYASIRNTPDGLRLFIFNDDSLKMARASIIGQDPVEVEKFCGFNKEADCNPMDLDFRTDGHLISAVIPMAWESMLRMRGSSPADIENNDLPNK